jgi:hypothetical protein
MAGFLSLCTRGFTTTVLIIGGGVTPAEGARCPGEVLTMAIGTPPAEVVDGSVPTVSAEPPAGSLGRHFRSVCHEPLYSHVLGGCREGVERFG